MPRYFTPATAEALLPTVEPLLREIQSLRAELAAGSQSAEDLRERAKSNGHAKPVRAINGLAAELAEETIEACLRQITEMGVQVKDLDTGLIDFPMLRDGHEIYLCWKLGEGERILWWHEIESGFAGRQPLDFDA